MNTRSARYYSHGKLLLSGEYLILDGAIGLALPTRAGQSLEVTPNTEGVLRFTSKDEKGNPWFGATIAPGIILREARKQDPEAAEAVLATTDIEVATTLVKMLLTICRTQPSLFASEEGLDLISQLEFPRDWGLGSSSTFINNLAQWSNTDPYAILKASLGGSGYDIACAGSETPLTFYLDEGTPSVQTADLDLPFKDQLYFVHLNKKQNSRQGIASYRALSERPEQAIKEATAITQAMLTSKDIATFGALLDQHEALISSLLGIRTVREERFADYQGHLKSLGAWGGDFILATAVTDPSAYFQEKGYSTVIPYREMIL